MELSTTKEALNMSRSLTDLPEVKVTDTANMDIPSIVFDKNLENVRETRSHPCSPQIKRKAFTTWVGGTQYIIGKVLLIFLLCIVYVFNKRKSIIYMLSKNQTLIV